MKFSTKSTYGLRAMVILAKNYNQTMSLPSISNSENISLSYLEGIFAKLKKKGLIEAEKGVSGGYRLGRKPVEISVYDIIQAVEGGFAPFYCLSEKSKTYCQKTCSCGINLGFIMVQNEIKEKLQSINLTRFI